MNKKIKKWIDFIGKRNMIAISALVVVLVVVCVGFAIKNNSKETNGEDVSQEESVGLQVEENADDIEGDSVDFSEFESENDKKDDKTENKKDDKTENKKDDKADNKKDDKTEDKKDNTSNSDSLVEQDNADDAEGDSIDFNEIVKEEEKKEEPKLDVELDKDSKKGYKINKEDNAFKDLKKEVQNTIKEIKDGKTTSLPKDVKTKLSEKTVVCDVFDLEPEKGQKKDKDGYYTVELTVDNLSEKYTKVVVLHYSEARELWEVIEPTKVDGDKITVKFADLSPVIICGELVEDNKKDDTLTENDKDPVTGEDPKEEPKEDPKEDPKEEPKEDPKEDPKDEDKNNSGAEFGPLF